MLASRVHHFTLFSTGCQQFFTLFSTSPPLSLATGEQRGANIQTSVPNVNIYFSPFFIFRSNRFPMMKEVGFLFASYLWHIVSLGNHRSPTFCHNTWGNSQSLFLWMTLPHSCFVNYRQSMNVSIGLSQP